MTVQFQRIDGFNLLPVLEAMEIVNSQLLPACQSQGVQTLNLRLSIRRIQKAYASLDRLVRPWDQYKLHSRHLRDRCEYQTRVPPFDVTHSEMVVAMLLQGYEAYFFNEGKSYDCIFKAI
jgi:hypothetical protein